jgi:glycosyltransferase involved in cell wall biosynthesis
MRIAHVGPPLAPTGGPAGYLRALRLARESSEEILHQVLLPDDAPPPRARKANFPGLRLARRWKRALLGPPKLYRPSSAELAQEGGVLHDLIARAAADAVALCRPSVDPNADIYVVHDVFAAEALKSWESTELWLMIHSPMPIALYLAWNWGHPERTWEEIAATPDVRRWIERELEIWQLVDRVVLPCPEALLELARVDARFAHANPRMEYLLTGSSVAAAVSSTSSRRREPVGLFLGTSQPYRGLDLLFDALELLPDRKTLPGDIAVAGPDPDSIPSHPRVRKLGRVEDVAALLVNVDFLVNTNRFSLFDLSNIEAAAAGKLLVLHAVGGNLALARLGAGCRLFHSPSARALAEALGETFATRREELAMLGVRSRACYEQHLTGRSMWLRHVELYDRAESRVAV